MSARRFAPLALAALVVACGGSPPPPAASAPAPVVPAPAPAPAAEAPHEDLPATHPEPGPTPAFQVPVPVAYTRGGLTVWLVERHALPIVAVSIAVPSGSSSDPKGEAGLAAQTAQMLEEGAGKRGALDFAKAVHELGASIVSDASEDASFVHLSVIKRSFAPAMQLLGDAVARPRFEAVEWKRVHDLWVNELKERASEPGAVAALVRTAAYYGADHPYGHPVDGLLATAPAVTLPEAKRFYAQAWRPDRAVVVAVGDVTKDELDAQLDAALGTWKTPATPASPVATPAAPAPRDGKTRVIIVDRPGAPQAVVSAVRAGLPVVDARYTTLARANVAIGASFTSRINDDLREKHGWTYSASTRLSGVRGAGVVRAGASLVTEHAVEAIVAMLHDLDDFAQGGLTDAEVAKTREQARGDMVSFYETVDHVSDRLATAAVNGLPPDWDAKAAAAADAADKPALDALARSFYAPSGITIVIVGPRAKLEPQLAAAGLGPVEAYDAEGNPAGAKPQAGAKK